MSEKDLAKYFVEYLNNNSYDVYQEVPTYGCVCDIIAIKNDYYYSIEVKTSLSFDVMEQATRNKKFSNYSYVAIPKKRTSRHFQKHICELLGIGVIEYNPKNKKCPISIILEAKFNDKVKKPKVKNWQKMNEAGSQFGRITPFGYYISSMKDLLNNTNGLSFKEVYDSLEKHYKSYNSFRSSIIKYINNGVISDIKTDMKKLYYKYEKN